MILKNNKRIDGCSDTVPIGTLNPFLGSTAPYGYLICQGQKVSKTTYKELYEICGDTFGQSTDTEFYLPDLRGQTIAGYKEGDSAFGTLGGLIGSLTHLHSTGNHTLTVDEMPSHYHELYDAYWTNENNVTKTQIHGNNENSRNVTPNRPLIASGMMNMGRTGGSQPHNHGDTSSTSSVQPTIVLNWIVKAFQLMPNQSYVSTIGQNSDINTYSCNYINNIIPDTQDLGDIIVNDIECKNLANIDNFVVDGKGTTSALTGVRYIYNLEPNTTYTLSFIKERISGISISNLTIYDVGQIDFYSRGTKISTVGGTTTSLESGASKRLSKTITTPDNCDSIRIVFFNNNGDTNANTMVSEVQLEKGDKGTSYIPYKKFGYNSQESMGNIVVDNVSCKNLFYYGISSETINGVTFTINNDKSITINGTAVGSADFYLNLNYKPTLNGIYTLGKGINNYAIQLYIFNNNNSIFMGGDTQSITNDLTNQQISKLMIRVVDGQTVNNITIYPQLEKGNIATGYVEYKEFSNKEIYSTEEQVIGTWIDKKPLYRKVLFLKDKSLISKTELSLGTIANIENVVKCDCNVQFKAGSTWAPIPFSGLSQHNFNINNLQLQYVTINSINGEISIVPQFGSNANQTQELSKIILVVEYTKTTD